MPRFLAIDWDHQQVHLVAATISGGAVRIQRAEVWQQPHAPNVALAEDLGKWLKLKLKESGIAPAPVLACLGRDRVILKDLRYPPVPPADEAGVIRFQAVKELTDPPNEVVIDYAPVPNGGTEKRAFAIIIRRELRDAYQQMCQAAGLRLAGLVPRPYGIAACLQRLAGSSVLTPAPEPPDAPVAVLTLGEKWAEFTVVKGGKLVSARSLNATGNLAGEVRRNLMLFSGQSSQQPVQAFYLAGSREGLRESLLDSLNVPVYSLDPFGGAERADLPATGRGGFTGAVGLLHAMASKQPLPINFVAPKEPTPFRGSANNRLLVLVGALAAAVVLALGGVGYAQIAALDTQIAELTEVKKELDGLASKLDEDEKRIKGVTDWVDGEVVWLDELYDLTDRFPNNTTLRLVQMTGDPLARTAKSKYAAKLSLKGVATDDHVPVDDLMSQLVKDGHYRVEPKNLGRNTGTDRFQFSQQFTTKVDIEKQPPVKYVRRLPAPPKEEKKDKPEPPGFGGFPGFGDEP